MTVKCACPSIDAKWCIVIRYGPTPDGQVVEPCECSCHAEWDERAHEDTEDWWPKIMEEQPTRSDADGGLTQCDMHEDESR